jgi:Raf kinase inhibitor-like YbhB/YbcL family protein
MNMNTTTTFRISSPSFQEGAEIPVQFTCDGKDMNPALQISGIPAGTASLALVVEDPDAASGNWVHWVVWNLKPDGLISENSIPGTEGINDFGRHHYGGPCPPSGTHRYYFRVYALDSMLSIPGATDRYQLAAAMKDHLLAETAMMGRYTRAR